MEKLRLADKLSLPIDAVTQKFAFLGRTGSGKTYGAGKLAELFLDAGAQIVVLDGIGVWYGLRLKADGKSKGFSIPVFGGEQGDVPLEPQAGRLIAKLIVEEGFSAVLDVSNFRKHERKTFVTDFAEELFHRKKTKRSALHFFCEESQMFIPERSGKDGARMLGAFEDLIKLGRNYGIGASLISQRPQAVNKEVLNQTEVLLAFQMTGIHERKAIAAWISEKGIGGEKLEDLLPALKVGDAKVWSPQWLQFSDTVHIAPKTTYDASSTPTVGAAIVQTKELSPVDVEKIKTSMADVVKRAESIDPKKLQAEITRLTRELDAKLKTVADVATKEVIKEVPVIPAEAIEGLTKEISAFRADYNARLDTIAQGFANLNGSKYVERIETSINKMVGALKIPVAPITRDKPTRKPTHTLQHRSETTSNLKSHAVGTVEISRPQQKLLDTLKLFESFGVTEVKRSNLAAFAGVSPRSSGFEKNLSTLRNHESGSLVDYLPGSQVALTDLGRSIANEPETRFAANADILDAWCRHISNPQELLLRILFSIYPDSVYRDELAGRAGVSPLSSGFEKNLGTMRSLGLIDYGLNKTVVATDLLFPFAD
jgi:acetolactate synthase small subunit